MLTVFACARRIYLYCFVFTVVCLAAVQHLSRRVPCISALTICPCTLVVSKATDTERKGTTAVSRPA